MSLPVPVRIAFVFIVLISLPYFNAFLQAGSDTSFGGFLMNPQDGNSYLAKMYQGWRGEWQFRLPYSAATSEGAYLFTFYLALGHLARWLGMPLVMVYHLARLVAAGFLVWVLWRFFKAMGLVGGSLLAGFALAVLGSGMGWLAFPFGVVTSDFWVAEAYPFLSAYTNPHFSLSLALMLWLLLPALENAGPGKIGGRRSWGMGVITLLAAACMTSMSPFTLVLVVGILGGVFAWEAADQAFSARKTSYTDESQMQPVHPSGDPVRLLRQGLWIALGGVPVAFSSYFSIQQDEILRVWNTQNLTLTPALWDLVLAFSPALLLALPGAWFAIRRGERPGRLLVVWACLAFLLAYLPLGLQRRFLVGMYVPLAALAAFGLDFLAQRAGTQLKLMRGALMTLALPTALLVLVVGQFGIYKKDPLLFLEKREKHALEWIEANTPEHALVLASPRLGMYIPAHTGRRVIYGHEFETIRASEEKAAVDEFFRNVESDPGAARRFLEQRRVNYVLFIPEEDSPGVMASIPGIEQVYDQGEASIYRVRAP